MGPPPPEDALLAQPLATPWRVLAERVMDGHQLTRDEGLAILRAADDQLLDILSAAFRIRQRWFGKTVQLHFLVNAKSGLCPEDCGYCSQSRDSRADIPKYNLISRDALLRGAQLAHERNAATYCIAISARSPSEREMRTMESTAPEIKRRYDLRVCASLGMLTPQQAQRLKQCGVDRVNHNLNTSPSFYSKICSTHTYEDRLATLRAAHNAGLEICSGGIIGMGEEDRDVVEMALQLRDAQVTSIPINFLNPIPGTPLEGVNRLDPRYCLKTLALLRFANPDREIRIAGGRELHLGSMQALGLYPANSLFVGDYLTTQGQSPETDYKMIQDLGFEVTRGAVRS